MAGKITIPKYGFEGLAALAELGPEKIVRLAELLQAKALTLDLTVLADNLAAELQGCAARDIETAIRSVLIPLNELRSKFRLSPERFLASLDEEIIQQAKPDWKDRYLDRWRSVSTYLPALLGSDSYFSTLGKALDLLANRPAVVVGLKILSELRPVYDEDADRTQAMLLTNTLVVEYVDTDKARRTLHLTVDMDDLRTMKDELERVQRKNQLLRKDAKALQVDVLAVGEES